MNVAYNNCQSCGRLTPIFYADIESYTGLIVGCLRKVESGFYCSECAEKLSRKAVNRTLTVGLFSIWALYYVPAVLINHSIIKNRSEKVKQITVIDTLPTKMETKKSDLMGCLFVLFVIFAFFGYMYWEFFYKEF